MIEVMYFGKKSTWDRVVKASAFADSLPLRRGVTADLVGDNSAKPACHSFPTHRKRARHISTDHGEH